MTTASNAIKFAELVNVNDLNALMANFNEVIGIANAVIDMDGVVITHSGWQQACTQFHRVNPITCGRCIQSDTALVQNLTQGSPFAVYRCLNGLVDTAAPIIVDGQHVANVFTGQFFTEAPDLEFFRKQALQFHFDETTYLDAIRKVPVIPMERVEGITRFYANIARLLADQGLDRLRQKEAEKQLKQLNDELQQQVDKRTWDLSQKNLLLLAVLDAIPSRVFWKDRDSRYLGCNYQLAQDAGLSSTDAIVGLMDDDLPWSDKAEFYRADDRAVMQNGQPRLHYDETARLPDGSVRYVSTSKVPLLDAEGKVVGLLGAYEDITTRKQAELAEIASEKRFHAYFDRAVIGLTITSLEKGWLEVNDALCKTLGYSREELMRMTWAELTYPEDLQPDLVQFNRMLAGEIDSYAMDKRFFHKDGHLVYTRLAVSNVCKEDGSVDYVVAMVEDITESQKAKMRLERLNKLNQTFITVQQSIMRLNDEPELFAQVCKAAVEYGGMTMAWIGMQPKGSATIRSLASYGSGVEYLDGLVLSARADVPEGHGPTGTALRENRIVVVNNYFNDPMTAPWQERVTRYGFNSAATFPIVCAGQPYAVLTVYSDHFDAFDEEVVTLLQRMAGDISFALDGMHSELQRTAAVQALERSNADLEQFAYSVSHDMRQPLRMVSGHLQLLARALDDRLELDDRENLNFALDGAKRMDAMIVSLLDYSRVGRLTQPKDWLASRDVLDEAMSFLAPAIEETHAMVTVGGDWPKIYASRDELSRLFQNLIGNALHYHPPEQPPQIEVSSSVTVSQWQVKVRDHGIGIDPKQIDRLFKFFSRLQSRTQFEGTGMGLAHCRRIVEHHNGRIWAESEGEGCGSTFIFEIPLSL